MTGIKRAICRFEIVVAFNAAALFDFWALSALHRLERIQGNVL